MARSGDGDQENHRRYQELCAGLNMDRTSAEEAWQCYQRISASYTLEGDCLHWLACALYVACRKGSVPTVGRSTVVEGNCVSLTRLLRSCKLSLVHFFNKMKKWSDMANLSHEMRQKVDRLERNFNVSTVIFKKFEPIFKDIFTDPSLDTSKPNKSRKPRKSPCSSSDIFSFCWTLFAHVKGHFSAISDDLVNSFHLLLCCVDLLFSNSVIADRKDILKANFAGLPERFSSKDYKVPNEQICIIDWLCKAHQGLVVEAKGIKEHWWKPYIKRLIEKKILKGKADTLSGLLEVANFDLNCKAVNKEYETFVLNSGDFDERIFLGENAEEEIGTPAKHASYDMESQIKLKNSLQRHMQESKHLTVSTPLTGRKYLKDKEALGSTPVSMATQSVLRLQTLLAERKPYPSEQLTTILNEYASSSREAIMTRANEMGELFCTHFTEPSDDNSDNQLDFAKKRLHLGQTLYFKTLENILVDEITKRKILPNPALLLENDAFHRSLFACCLEIVIFSYNSQRIFPWILEVFDLQPYYFYKVIEVLIRGEEGLSRDVVKHLNHIEEQVLESLAWKFDSVLWDALKAVNNVIPSCQEVALPNQTEAMAVGSTLQVLQSPLAHPSYRKSYSKRDIPQSPLASPSPDRQIKNSSVSSGARRRLFRTEGIEPDEPPRASNTVLTSAGAGTIILHPVQGENGITTYIPVSAITLPTVVQTQPALQVKSENVTSANTERPKKSNSLSLFFRKVYHLSGVRLRELCDRLGLGNEDIRRQIWTCFEHSLMNCIDLMCDRHLDQLMMCSVYVICKVRKEDQSFQEIMRCYRLQPQATSHVYRSVLIQSKKRRNSGSSDNSKHGGSNSPSAEGEVKRDVLRSSSTLPVPHPNSQPPTPTRLAGSGTHFEFEDRGDLITFYNKVYVPLLQKFAVKFSQAANSTESPPLSPLPRLNASNQSPFRRVFSKHSLYISPLKNPLFPPSPNRPLSFSLGRSPAKDLRAINNMVRLGEKRVGKRILQDDGDCDSPSKKMMNKDLAYKIHNVIAERQVATVPPE